MPPPGFPSVDRALINLKFFGKLGLGEPKTDAKGEDINSLCHLRFYPKGIDAYNANHISLASGKEASPMPANGLSTTLESIEAIYEADGFALIDEDARSDIAVFWWGKIASDVAVGRRSMPQFIRDRLADDELAAALTDVEQIAFFAGLDEMRREERDAYEGRVRER